ncbi:MAG TPA: hypothetical protein VGG69_05245 [Rhizomicrobium sp.]
MKTRFVSLALFGALATMTVSSGGVLAGVRMESGVSKSIKDGRAVLTPFHRIVRDNTTALARSDKAGVALSLPLWQGSFVDKTPATRNFTMVGTDPATHNSTTTIPVVIVPLKVQFYFYFERKFDPGRDVVANTGGINFVQTVLNSPLFRSVVDFKSGDKNLGRTQYLDAFQRGNFWKSVVTTNPQYHIMLGSPTVLPSQLVRFPGKYESGVWTMGTANVGLVDGDYLDSQIRSIMTRLTQINPSVLPIFLTDNILVRTSRDGNCCIGGWHGSIGSQTYIYAGFVDDTSGSSFGSSTTSLGHELAEWLDDPFNDNNVNCTDVGALEVGDPLNFSIYEFPVGGYTYRLQSLAYLPYFGAPRSTSANGWYSLNGSHAQNPNSNDSVTEICPGPQRR